MNFSKYIIPCGTYVEIILQHSLPLLPGVKNKKSRVLSFFDISAIKIKFNMWWIYALLSAFFAALTAIFAKVGVKNIDSDLATAIRTVIILCIAWGITFFKGALPGIQNLTKQNWIFLILSAIATGLSWLFYFRALQLGKVSQVSPVDKSSVAIAIILSVIFLGEALTWKTAVGALLIIGGTLVLIF